MRYLYLISLLFLSLHTAIAQEDPDSILNDAGGYAAQGNYDKALEILKDAEQKYPDNEEIIVYKGRVLSWKKDYSSAEAALKPLTDRQVPNNDALGAIVNTYYWWEKYEECLIYCDKLLLVEPKNEDIMLIKANCLERLGRDDDAVGILNNVLLSDSNNPGIAALRTLIGKKAKNAVAASYLNVSTADPGTSPLHYGYVEYTRKLNRSSIVGRANIGHVNDDTQALFEADYYHTFRSSNYLYLNAGVSTGKTVFPVARGGIEYYFTPFKAVDLSLGVRYMHFETEDVVLATGHIAYNFNTYSVGYRPFYDTENELFSHVLSLQKTNEEKERIIRLELQYGNVPYLYLYNSLTQPLKAYRAGLQYQHRIGNSLFVRPVVLYEYEEYIPDEFRHRFNAQIIVTKRF